MSNVNPEPNQKPGIETMSLVGFILGLISFLINFWGIVGGAGLIFSILGLNKRVTGTSKTFAIVGAVSGGINLLYGFMQLI
jgi:hypothetical protein